MYVKATVDQGDGESARGSDWWIGGEGAVHRFDKNEWLVIYNGLMYY